MAYLKKGFAVAFRTTRDTRNGSTCKGARWYGVERYDGDHQTARMHVGWCRARGGKRVCMAGREYKAGTQG